MQRGRRPRGEGGPGRGVYLARRIIAALVVVLLLALLGTWAWQTLFRVGQEPGSEAPEITSAGSTGSEETAAEEGSAGGTEEQGVVSQQGRSERLESSIRASTPEGRVIGSSNVAGVTAAMVSSYLRAAGVASRH